MIAFIHFHPFTSLLFLNECRKLLLYTIIINLDRDKCYCHVEIIEISVNEYTKCLCSIIYLNSEK